MNIKYTHPRELISNIIGLVYRLGLTTTSGGNISVLDEDGNIWITPAGVDKGNLGPKDIVKVKPDGNAEGIHRPSSEFPFHKAIYDARPDLRAIIHAHPPALVSFSIVRKIPNTSALPQAQHLCGPVGYAPYKLPGSVDLGESIATEFKSGFNCVIMENHGTVVGGSNLLKTFQRFETLEFCARSIIKANEIGQAKFLTQDQILQFEHRENLLPEFDYEGAGSNEKEIRSDICSFVRRACAQKLMISSYGTVSVRLSNYDFLITPTSKNRRFFQLEDIVYIKDGHRERGKLPSRAVMLHQQIYEKHGHIHCIISTQSSNANAFCISGEKLDTRTIPESYILLEDIPLLPYGSQLKGSEVIVNTLKEHVPIIMIQNDSILVTGKDILETFDRLEVAEFSARSLISATHIGMLTPIGEEDIEQLKDKFLRK
jgi:L-fuculose-phosphate aldolase